jgi:hypothetical protein
VALTTITFSADGSAPTGVTRWAAVDANTGDITIPLPIIQGGAIADGDQDPTNNPTRCRWTA